MEAQRRKTQDTPLFDHFLVVRLEDHVLGGGNAGDTGAKQAPRARRRGGTPAIKFHFAAAGATGAGGVSAALASFCFPDADELIKTVDEEKSQAFVFVLTEGDGSRSFGYCRRFLPLGKEPRFPECVCLVSRHYLPMLMHDIMDTVHVRWVVQPGAVFPFLEECLRVGVPKPGHTMVVRVQSPDKGEEQQEVLTFRRRDHRLSVNVPLEPLFEALSVDNILLLMSALLCEQRILLCSSNISLLSSCVHASVALLQPLEWQQVFIPILPGALLNYSCAPMPFVMGVSPTHLEEVLTLPVEELVVVDLDNDAIQSASASSTSAQQTSSTFGFPMPRKLTSRLKKELKNRPKEKADKAISDAFIAFMRVLLQHAFFDDDHCISASVGRSTKKKWDVDGFVAETERELPDLAGLIRVMSHSQMFEHFANTRLFYTRTGAASFDRYTFLAQATSLVASSYKDVLKKANEMSGAKREVSAAQMALQRSSIKAQLSLKMLESIANKTVGFIKSKIRDQQRDSDVVQLVLAALEITSNRTSQAPPKDLLPMLTMACFDSDFCSSICDVIWVRARDSAKKNWKHGYKALALLEHLIKYGSDQVVLNALQPEHLRIIDDLTLYGHQDASAETKMKKMASKVQHLVRNVFHLRNHRQYVAVAPIKEYVYREPQQQDASPPQPQAQPQHEQHKQQQQQQQAQRIEEEQEREPTAATTHEDLAELGDVFFHSHAGGIASHAATLGPHGRSDSIQNILDLDFFGSSRLNPSGASDRDEAAHAADMNGFRNYREQSLQLMLSPVLPTFEAFHEFCVPADLESSTEISQEDSIDRDMASFQDMFGGGDVNDIKPAFQKKGSTVTLVRHASLVLDDDDDDQPEDRARAPSLRDRRKKNASSTLQVAIPAEASNDAGSPALNSSSPYFSPFASPSPSPSPLPSPQAREQSRAAGRKTAESMSQTNIKNPTRPSRNPFLDDAVDDGDAEGDNDAAATGDDAVLDFFAARTLMASGGARDVGDEWSQFDAMFEDGHSAQAHDDPLGGLPASVLHSAPDPRTRPQQQPGASSASGGHGWENPFADGHKPSQVKGDPFAGLF